MTAVTNFRLQVSFAVLFAATALLTLVQCDWLEAVFGVDPDQHNGSLEWIVSPRWPSPRSRAPAWHAGSGTASRSVRSRAHGTGGGHTLCLGSWEHAPACARRRPHTPPGAAHENEPALSNRS